MKLFTKAQYERLIENSRTRGDHTPVVKLFTPDANCTWLISEIDPSEPDIAFGLCDLGMGMPELGSIYLPEIIELRGRLGLSVERDYSFEGRYPLTVYADAARMAEYITEDDAALQQAQAAQRKEKG